MEAKTGVRYRIVTYASGRREKVAMVGDKVISRKSLPKVRLTKSAKRLNSRRRRIGL